MESFNDIKSLWHTDEPDNLPRIAEIKHTVRKYSRKKKLNNSFAIAALVGVLITFLLIITFTDFKMWTSYIGIMFFMGTAGYTMYLKIKRHSNLSDLEVLSNNDFLSALEQEENQTCIGKAKNQSFLFVTWATGFAFYIYEFITYGINYLLVGYAGLVVLGLFIWFVYRPLMTKRYQKDIKKTLDHIHHLKSQMNDNY